MKYLKYFLALSVFAIIFWKWDGTLAGVQQQGLSDPIINPPLQEQQNADPSAIQVDVYPNPFTTFLNFDIQTGGDAYRDVFVEVYDASGRRLMDWRVTAPTQFRWDLDKDYPTGMYVIRCRDEERNLATRKVLKRSN